MLPVAALYLLSAEGSRKISLPSSITTSLPVVMLKVILRATASHTGALATPGTTTSEVVSSPFVTTTVPASVA